MRKEKGTQFGKRHSVFMGTMPIFLGTQQKGLGCTLHPIFGEGMVWCGVLIWMCKRARGIWLLWWWVWCHVVFGYTTTNWLTLWRCNFVNHMWCVTHSSIEFPSNSGVSNLIGGTSATEENWICRKALLSLCYIWSWVYEACPNADEQVGFPSLRQHEGM